VMILRELAAEPATVTQLLYRTALPLERIERDLACLYYAGAITTTESKSRAARRGPPDSRPDSDEMGVDSVLRDPAHSQLNADLTAPLPLDQMPRPRPRRDS